MAVVARTKRKSRRTDVWQPRIQQALGQAERENRMVGRSVYGRKRGRRSADKEIYTMYTMPKHSPVRE